MTKAFSTETKEEAPAASEKSALVLEACTTTKGKGDGVEAPARGKKLLMPEEDVKWILSRKRGVFAPHTLPQLSQDQEKMQCLVDGVEAFNYLSDSFYGMQAEIRAEFDAKGCVEVDDDFFERREEYRQMVEEVLADLFDGIVFTEDELSKD